MSTALDDAVNEENRASPRLALLLAAAMFVLVVDTSLMNVSISAVIKDLHTTASGVQSAIALEALDYKNPDILKKFVTESGKILPRRVTGMPAHMHRKITREIKRSRSVLLMK